MGGYYYYGTRFQLRSYRDGWKEQIARLRANDGARAAYGPSSSIRWAIVTAQRFGGQAGVERVRNDSCRTPAVEVHDDPPHFTSKRGGVF